MYVLPIRFIFNKQVYITYVDKCIITLKVTLKVNYFLLKYYDIIYKILDLSIFVCPLKLHTLKLYYSVA